MLGFRVPTFIGRLTRAPAEKNEFPNSVVPGEWEKAWWKKNHFDL